MTNCSNNIEVYINVSNHFIYCIFGVFLRKINDEIFSKWIILATRIPKLILFLHISNFFTSSGRYPVWEIICHFVNCFPHEDIRHGDFGTESFVHQ